jgi:hypothetical protein
LLLISNAKKRMDREIEQGTHPELVNVDENFRAGYYYNTPGRAISSAKDWATKNKSRKLKKNPGYLNEIELRMDEGSYPYKLMEQAKDLGIGVDFDKGRDLEEVVVRGFTDNKPQTTYIKKQNGGTYAGWLDKYK